jgi:hypothetical protein
MPQTSQRSNSLPDVPYVARELKETAYAQARVSV